MKAETANTVQAQNLTLDDQLPLDRPVATRPHRIYVATTNHCNRACPWCCTCSSPRGQSWLKPEDYFAAFPDQGNFEIQLEGGEPTLHPQLDEMIRLAREHPRCSRLILVSNGSCS